MNNLNIEVPSSNKSLIINNSLNIISYKERIDLSLKKIFGEKKIKKILLINPPDANKSTFDFDRAKRKRNSDYPPYGLLIVGRHLLNNGYEVEILNLHHEVSKKCVETKNNIEFNFENFWKKLYGKK